jgi:hypothetical protein
VVLAYGRKILIFIFSRRAAEAQREGGAERRRRSYWD